MSNIIFACISPHPPIILPSVGSPEDRNQVKNTIENLEKLGKKLSEVGPQSIIISSPHPDWGFEVPLYFLAKDFPGKIERVLISLESPQFYFEEGKKVYNKLKIENLKLNPAPEQVRYGARIALIASGDLSHCLREDGPYGFNPQGPKFDKDLMDALKKKDIEKILKLDDLYPEAGKCGLRSICFLLGILEASGQNWTVKIFSYEGPFGVGYLVADFKL